MKKLLIIALILAISTAAYSGTPEVNVSVNTNAATFQTSFSTPFATTSTAWSVKNLAYGPIEIIGGALAPLGGLLLGGLVGAILPVETMDKNKYIVIPYSTIAGAASGTAMGALTAPIIILEGVIDTITGGLFADRPFSWFKFSEMAIKDDAPAIRDSAEKE